MKLTTLIEGFRYSLIKWEVSVSVNIGGGKRREGKGIGSLAQRAKSCGWML